MRSRVMSSMTRCSASTSDASASRRARSSAKEGGDRDRRRAFASPVVARRPADLLRAPSRRSRAVQPFGTASSAEANVELLIAGAIVGSRQECSSAPSAIVRLSRSAGSVRTATRTEAARGRPSPREPGRMSAGFFAFFGLPEGPRGSPRRPSPRRARARGPGARRPVWDEARRAASTSRAGGRYSSDSAAYADINRCSRSRSRPRRKDELLSRTRARGAGGGGSGTEGGGGTSRVSGDACIDVGFVGGATTAGASSATAAGLGFGSSMGTVSSLAFARAQDSNASSFARPFAAAADLPAMAPQARRGHRRRAGGVRARRAPPSAGGRSVVGPDDAVSCAKRFRGFRLMMRSIVILKMCITSYYGTEAPRRSVPRERRRERRERPAGLLVSVAVFPHMPALSPAAPRVPCGRAAQTASRKPRLSGARRVEARALALRQQLFSLLSGAHASAVPRPPRDPGTRRSGSRPRPYQRPRPIRAPRNAETPGTRPRPFPRRRRDGSTRGRKYFRAEGR